MHGQMYTHLDVDGHVACTGDAVYTLESGSCLRRLTISSFPPSNSLLPVFLLLLLLHPFSVSHLKLLLLSVDSFARLKKRSRITE